MREVKDITAMSVDERIAYAKANSPLTEEELQMIKEGSALTTDRADHMVENVIGVYSLPYSIAPGFVINGKEMIVPMVGEEPYVTKSTTSGRPSGSCQRRIYSQYNRIFHDRPDSDAEY